MKISSENLTFNPSLNLARITQRKLRRVLMWLFYLFLILFGLYEFFLGLGEWIIGSEFGNIFYVSLLTDMFLIYLWQRRKERMDQIKATKPGKRVEVSLYLEKSTRGALEKAWLLCWRKKHHTIKPLHLFFVLIKKKEFQKIIKRLGADPKGVIKKTKALVKEVETAKTPKTILDPEVGNALREVFKSAYVRCLKEGSDQIGVLDFFWASAEKKELINLIFEEFGVSKKDIVRAAQWAKLEKEARKREKWFSFRKIFKPRGGLGRAMTGAITPTLDKASRDWTGMARQEDFEFVLGREKEIEKIYNIFSSGEKGVVLVGPGKIGKKAVIKKLAQLMVAEKVPSFLKDKRLMELDVSSLVGMSDAKMKGEEYLKRIIAEVNRAGNIVLLIRDIDRLDGLRTHSRGLDFSEIIASGLETKGFYFIATSSPKKFSYNIEDKILGRMLQPVKILSPSQKLLWKILATKALIIEKELEIIFSVNALEKAIVAADQYLYAKSLTARAIDLIVEAGSLASKSKGKNGLVEGKDIINLVSKKTDIPLGELKNKEKKKLLNLEKLIHKRMVNQKEAVSAVAAALRRSRLRSKRGDRPIANFLFVGATGVGKTELARTLARVYFGSVERMIRLDMSEYQTKQSIDRLMGRAEGQRVSKGYLTEAIKRQPFSLLLLDELEKAHNDILNLFLQVMDDGRLTDASGETINFANVILIATSNAGTQFVQEKTSKGVPHTEIGKQLEEGILLQYFSPEFLNRFDKIVLFETLSQENIIKIAMIFLKRFKEKLAAKGVGLEMEQEAVEELAQAGYDPEYGARPLRRVIQDQLESPVARLFLEGRLERRDKLIIKKGPNFEVEKAKKIG